MDMKIGEDKKKWCISVPGKQNKPKPQILSIFYNKISTNKSFFNTVKKKEKKKGPVPPQTNIKTKHKKVKRNTVIDYRVILNKHTPSKIATFTELKAKLNYKIYLNSICYIH